MALYSRATTLFDEGDRGIQRAVEDFYQRNIEANQAFWAEADLDTRTESGDFEHYYDYFNVPIARRKQFSFNINRPITNMINGYQRDNRKSIVAVPIENGDQATADQFSKVLSWLNRDQWLGETISDAFGGACITGLNLLHIWMDYRNDPVNGDIRIDNRAYNSFMIDSFYRKSDLSDCNGILTRTFLTKQEIKSLLPGKDDLIDEVNNIGADDGKFQFLPEMFRFDRSNLLAYDEYYYRSYRTQKLLVDTSTDLTYEWKSNNDKGLREFLQQYPQITVKESQVPTVKLAILVNGKVVYDDQNPLGIDEYPFVPVFAYFNPQTMFYQWRIQGVTRGLRDAQWLFNRRKVIELDVAESQLTSGWIYKENTLVNPMDAHDLAGQGKALVLKKGADMGDIQQVQARDIPMSFFQLSENLQREIQRISGVNEELMGSADDDKAGILSMLRQGAGLRTLKKLFDQLDFSQKLLGRILIKVIQEHFSPAKVKRIIEEEPTEQFYNKMFGRYDVAIEDGFDTTTQKQMQFAQLLYLREAGVPIPDESLLEAATIQNKDKIMKTIEQTKQQAIQQQQQQAEAMQAQQQAEMRMMEARATADEGLGLERISRVQENEQLAMERASQAEENRATARKEDELALLNMARTMRELEGMDIENFQKFLQLAQMYNQVSGVQQEKSKQDQMRNVLMEKQMSMAMNESMQQQKGM